CPAAPTAFQLSGFLPGTPERLARPRAISLHPGLTIPSVGGPMTVHAADTHLGSPVACTPCAGLQGLYRQCFGELEWEFFVRGADRLSWNNSYPASRQTIA